MDRDHHGHHGHSHGHGHGHGHSHELNDGQQLPVHGDQFTEINRKHWNSVSDSYSKEQWQKDLIKSWTTFIVSNREWIGGALSSPTLSSSPPSSSESASTAQKSVRVLDYACGPGTMTHALAGWATEFVGIDLSENMVKAYNSRFTDNPDDNDNQAEADKAGTSVPDQDATDKKLNAHAVVGNLFEESGTPQSLNDPQFTNFDVVIVGGGYHHFHNLTLATARLVERLKPGGMLLILDFVTHAMEVSEKGPTVASTIAHHGFSEEQLKGYFEAAGLTGFAMKRAGEKVRVGSHGMREAFLAKGVKL